MEFNRTILGVGLLILVGVAVLHFWMPSISPTALVSGSLPTYNPFIGKVTRAMENLFINNPQAVIEQSGRVGLVFPQGNSIQFANDPDSTDQDVVIILNATTAKLSQFHTFPTFVQNEFTYVSPEQLSDENPYVKALYPNGFYLMPINVEGSDADE